MSEKIPKKVFGRGRGKPVTGKSSAGPWVRSKKLEVETSEVRPPKKDVDRFVLNENNFPPLPGATSTNGQFDDADLEVKRTNSGEENLKEKTIPDFNGEKFGHTQLTSRDNASLEPAEEIEKGELEGVKAAQEVAAKDEDVEQFQENAMSIKDLNLKKGKEECVKENTEFSKPPQIDNNNSTVAVDVLNSNLSPFAAEFIPKLNPEASDFVPVTNTSYEESYNQATNANDVESILADLEETVLFCYSKLMETPALYDELVGVVTPHFIRYMENSELPKHIVLMLYEFAIQDMKFSYFAVKILIHLINITSTDENKELRNALLRHTQEEVNRVQTIQVPDCAREIEPFLSFLSELYIQLEVGGRRLSMIGISLVETLKKLLLTDSTPIKERLKIVVSMIKLTGLSLDRDDPTTLNSLFDDLRLKLEQEQTNLDSPTVQLVNDLVLLRNLNWGLVEPDSEDYIECDALPIDNQPFAPSNSGYDTNFDPNMPYASGVFYGPDGNPIGYEEQLFLEVETNALNHLQILDQGEPSPTSVEGFDEAYEEFLKTVPERRPQ